MYEYNRSASGKVLELSDCTGVFILRQRSLVSDILLYVHTGTYVFKLSAIINVSN